MRHIGLALRTHSQHNGPQSCPVPGSTNKQPTSPCRQHTDNRLPITRSMAEQLQSFRDISSFSLSQNALKHEFSVSDTERSPLATHLAHIPLITITTSDTLRNRPPSISTAENETDSRPDTAVPFTWASSLQRTRLFPDQQHGQHIRNLPVLRPYQLTSESPPCHKRTQA